MARARRKGRPIHGWLSLDKPEGMTSTEAVARVRRITQAAKVGHGGTLDPLATGVLPIALGGDIDAYLAEEDGSVPRVGMRAALFHPTTGYSLPLAARLADEIAAAPRLESAAISDLVRARARRHWRAGGFFRMLNRMMFLAAEPDRRYRVLQRFYRLPQPLIERFYAGRPTWADRAHLLVGEPPVPLLKVVSALPERAALRARDAHA
jgi:lycopene beta-cyclase